MITVKAENTYLLIFQDTVREHVEQIMAGVHESFDEAAVDGLARAFWNALHAITINALEGMRTDIIARDFPIVSFDSRLCTQDQKEQAARVLKQKLEDKTLTLSETLLTVVQARFTLLRDALTEMFTQLKTHKQEICETLFSGQEYSRFIRIQTAAGDYHAGGRAATILETELGKMVYKPRSLLSDVRTRAFAEKYFPSAVHIPQCWTDGKNFGVSEFLTRSVAHTQAEARKWFRALGSMAVMIQVLGSTDMHHENITAVDGLPAIIDLETILSPQMKPDKAASDGFESAMAVSLWRSCLMPANRKGMEVSVLADLDSPESSAPVISGKPATWQEYHEDFLESFRESYRKCITRRDELRQDIPKLFSDVPLRILVRDSQFYAELLIRTRTRKVLATPEAQSQMADKLERALCENLPERLHGAGLAEKTALMRGDIPLFSVLAAGHDLYSDGCVVCPGYMEISGVENALERLEHMNEAEMRFEEALLCGCFQYRLMKDNPVNLCSPELAETPLSPQAALLEAQEIWTDIFTRRLTAPNGAFNWLNLNADAGRSEILSAGMGTGFSGIALFASALQAAGCDTAVMEQTQLCLQRIRREMEIQLTALTQMPETELVPLLTTMLGEGRGFGGILRALVLMDLHTGTDTFAPLAEQILHLLSQHLDLSQVQMTDRLGGIAGLLATLCTYPELHERPGAHALISACARRLLELRSFEADGFTLWQTISPRHQISGAGHGMMGIAHSLYTAGRLLGETTWLQAADDAMAFEKQTYSEKFGSWPDHRSWPPQGIMHGYCSGAPGIGILCTGIDTVVAHEIAALASRTVDTQPLLYRDHLCCGNSAIVEYALSAGCMEKAGRILRGMRERKLAKGSYRFTTSGYRNVPDPTLAFGLSGVGYEMLRYACPGRVFPVY